MGRSADLEKIGLTSDQACVYSTLLQSESLTANIVARKCSLPRTRAYAVLQQLEKNDLISHEKKKGSVSRYFAQHPSALEKLSQHYQAVAEESRQSLELLYPDLLSSFNQSHNAPGVRILEGVEGFKRLHTDILRQSNELLLIRSILDAEEPYFSLILEQIRQQVAHGIHTRALTPTPPPEHIEVGRTRKVLEQDKRNLVTRRFLDRDLFGPTTQIVLFGKSVGISTLQQPSFTLIIDNPDVHDSWRKIFETLWVFASMYHEAFVDYLKELRPKPIMGELPQQNVQ